jgi:hypothetical protein
MMIKNIGNDSEIVISPNRIALVLTGIVIIIALGHIAAHAMSRLFNIQSTPLAGLFLFLDMGSESNLPTYVSALYLLFSGCLCILISKEELNRKKRLNWHWIGLAAGLLVMSVDEAAMIHEGVVGVFLRESVGRGEGIMYYVWYRAYIPLVLVIICLYLPFLKRLPLRYSSRLILSGLVYLSGSLGFEILESYLAYQGSSLGLNILIEETLEMMGVVILIYTLLLYLAESNYTLRFNFAADKIKPG